RRELGAARAGGGREPKPCVRGRLPCRGAAASGGHGRSTGNCGRGQGREAVRKRHLPLRLDLSCRRVFPRASGPRRLPLGLVGREGGREDSPALRTEQIRSSAKFMLKER